MIKQHIKWYNMSDIITCILENLKQCKSDITNDSSLMSEFSEYRAILCVEWFSVIYTKIWVIS